MAIVQNPLIGRASGKFSGAVFSTNYSKNVIRSRPVEFRDKKSASQLAQRSKFIIAQQWVVKFLTIIRTGFASLAVNKSAYIAALSWYLENGITGSPGSYEIDYTNAKFTFGDLAQIAGANIDYFNTDFISIDVDDNSNLDNASADDIGILILYDPLSDIIYTSSTANFRTSGILEGANIPFSHGTECHIWFYAQSSSGNSISESQYYGFYECTQS